jgi:hypothetical protein
MALYEILVSIIGQPPEGYEPIIYVIGGVIAYQLVELVGDLFKIAKWW